MEVEARPPSRLKPSINGSIRRKRALTICLVSFSILLLMAGLYFLCKPGAGCDLPQKDYYTVVVDCGSTGTRVNVYMWERSGSGNWSLPVLLHSYPANSTDTKSMVSKSSCNYHCMQTEPGLDKFVGNATGVRLSLEPLISLAEWWVPRDRHGDTPIFVLATAGLRSVQVADAKRILDDVEDVLQKHSFVYRRSWIRVLSGKEEAYYGWVALNYKMGSLGNSHWGSTLGLLDLGGSSLQVVMEVKDSAMNHSHLIRSKIGLVEHQIVTYSLPSFGLNEAFDRSVSLLCQAQHSRESRDEGLKIRHPCLSSDFDQNYTCYSCDWSAITASGKKSLGSQLGARGYVSTHLVGDPNWEQCKGIAQAAAVNSTGVDWSLATVTTDRKAILSSDTGYILNVSVDVHQTVRFHALSGFFAVYSMLKLPPVANLTRIEQVIEQLCSESWADMSSGSGNENSMGDYCFRVPYMLSLINHALCLGDKEIVFGPGDLSWTLGAALVEGDYLWLCDTRSNFLPLKNVEVVFSPIFVFLVLLCLLFVVYHSQIKLPMLGRKGPVGASLPSYFHPKRRPN